MNKRVIVMTTLLGFFVAAPLTMAAGKGLTTAASNIEQLIQTGTKIAYMLAFLAFFWGIAMFLFNAGDDEKRKKGMSIMIWSIVAIFVMTAIWGIVGVLSSTLGADNSNGPKDINIPTINFNGANK